MGALTADFDFAARPAACALPSLLVLRVTGEDAATWLQGQVTQDIRPATGEHAVYALFTNVRGKIMADAWIRAISPETFLVAVPESARAELEQSFEKYIIMEDVLVEPTDDRVVTVRGAGADRSQSVALPSGALRWATSRFGLPGYDVTLPSPEVPGFLESVRRDGVVEATEGALYAARVHHGVPAFGVDFDAQHYPQEASLRHAVSFNKGCYLGQEVVCTLESRGRVNRSLMRIDGPGAPPPAHTPITTPDGRTVGEITSATTTGDGFTGLGYVKTSLATSGDAIFAADAQLRVSELHSDD